MADLRNSLKGFRDAVPFGRGRYFVPGYYQCTVKQITAKTSQKDGKLLVIFELLVTKFTGRQYVSFVTGGSIDTEGAFSEGDTVSYVIDLGNVKYGQRNLKEIAAAILASQNGVSLTEAMATCDDDDIINLTAPEQPATGVTIQIDAWNVKTGAGKDFTALAFRP